MLAHDFGNGGGADAVTEIAVYDNAGAAALGRNFLEKQKNFTYPTRNRQFGWGALAHSVVQ
jgi:hypothetical protein